MASGGSRDDIAYAVNTVGLAKSVVLDSIMVGALLGVALTVVSGALSDRLGRKRVYNAGAVLGLLLAFPTAAMVQSGHTVAVAASFVAGLGLVYGTVYGPLAAFWSELFDTRYRYSALSARYQISGVVASGLTPLIAAWLVSLSGDTLWLVAAYHTAVATLSLTCARLLPETRGRDLHADVLAEPTPSGHRAPALT